MATEGADILEMDGVSNAVVAVLLATVVELAGDGSPGRVAAAAGDPRPLSALTDRGGWSTLEEILALFRAAATVTGDPAVARRAGERAFAVPAGNPLPDLLRAFGGPADALAFAVDRFELRSTVHAVTCEALADRSAVVAVRVRLPAQPDRLMCDYLAGVLSALPTLFGRAPATVTEDRCQSAGDDRCRYHLAWDGPAPGEEPAVTPATEDHGPTGTALEAVVRLATELAAVADPTAVAGRLAATVPAVTGGDRAVVLLWDAEEDRMVEAGRAGGRGAATVGVAPGVAACRVFLDRVARRGRPLPLRSRSTEPVVDDLCRLAGFTEGLLVPLVAHDTCYGLLVVDEALDTGEGRQPAGGSAPGAVGMVPPLPAILGLCAAAAGTLARLSLRSRAARLAMHDPLTGLADAQLLRAHLEPVLASTRRGADTGVVLSVDVDGLTAVNDAHGRSAGDRVLVTVADRLRAVVRDGDTVARVGGDEFAVVLPDLGSDEEALAVAERLAAACAVPVTIGGGRVGVTASIGIARCRADDTVDALLGRADRAMHRAKAVGPGRVHAGA